MTYLEMETKITEMLRLVPQENKQFVMSQDTFDLYFGSKHAKDYSTDFLILTSGMSIKIDPIAGDDIYLVEKPVTPVKETHECTECGDEVDEPGLCVFCFATASVGGLG